MDSQYVPYTQTRFKNARYMWTLEEEIQVTWKKKKIKNSLPLVAKQCDLLTSPNVGFICNQHGAEPE